MDQIEPGNRVKSGYQWETHHFLALALVQFRGAILLPTVYFFPHRQNAMRKN